MAVAAFRKRQKAYEPTTQDGKVSIDLRIDHDLPDLIDVEIVHLSGRSSTEFITFRLPEQPDYTFAMVAHEFFGDLMVTLEEPLPVRVYTDRPTAEGRYILGLIHTHDILSHPKLTEVIVNHLSELRTMEFEGVGEKYTRLAQKKKEERESTAVSTSSCIIS